LNEYVDKRMTDLTYDLTDVENSYEKLKNFINTTMERADQLNLKRNGGLSHKDAVRIVERANDIYDAYHYPNLFYEQKIHDLMDDLGVDDPTELNEMFKNKLYADERAEMIDYLDLVQTLHPHWNTSAIGLHKLESQLRALEPKTSQPSGVQARLPQTSTFIGPKLSPTLSPQQERDAYRQASARALGLQEEQPQGLPQPQPGQEQLPRQVVDIFGTRPQPGSERFAVPPNQENQQ
jgi:hypothetical protein